MIAIFNAAPAPHAPVHDQLVTVNKPSGEFDFRYEKRCLPEGGFSALRVVIDPTTYEYDLFYYRHDYSFRSSSSSGNQQRHIIDESASHTAKFTPPSSSFFDLQKPVAQTKAFGARVAEVARKIGEQQNVKWNAVGQNAVALAFVRALAAQADPEGYYNKPEVETEADKRRLLQITSQDRSATDSEGPDKTISEANYRSLDLFERAAREEHVKRLIKLHDVYTGITSDYNGSGSDRVYLYHWSNPFSLKKKVKLSMAILAKAQMGADDIAELEPYNAYAEKDKKEAEEK